jgi:hypothetical protein
LCSSGFEHKFCSQTAKIQMLLVGWIGIGYNFFVTHFPGLLMESNSRPYYC